MFKSLGVACAASVSIAAALMGAQMKGQASRVGVVGKSMDVLKEARERGHDLALLGAG